MEAISKFLYPVIIFVLTLGSGLWLSHTSKPLNPILFNIHKLIALGAVILTGIQIYKSLRITETQLMLVLMIILAVLSVIALFATGALMSIGTPVYEQWHMIHKIAPFLVAISVFVFVLQVARK